LLNIWQTSGAKLHCHKGIDVVSYSRLAMLRYIHETGNADFVDGK
jgi:hypothetical protein